MTTDINTLVVPFSTRSGSVNVALAHQIVADLVAQGDGVELIDLRDYEMPLYNGDDEAANGVPEAAQRLYDRFEAASNVVFVSPEYNGSYSPLMKNTFDWVSRIGMTFLQGKPLLLAAASPGGYGGARGLTQMRSWLTSIGVEVAESDFTVGGASVGDDGNLAELDVDALRAFTSQVITA